MKTDAPIVTTSYGRLQGAHEDGVSTYRGIPFARPPVGRLRFQPPQRAEQWSGVRDATRFGAGSYQANRPLAPVLGIVVPEQSEDCLTLNVWTSAPAGARRPVLVWIHGGAWVIGAGSEKIYDGSALVRRGDVVVVTINYRLGPFGFLRTRELGGDLDATGNQAMLDQIAALEWVRDEIAAFGGDPDNVAVVGNSAGSVNIACMLTMPRARGLFHRAILQSGSLNLLRPPQAAADIARMFLKELGIAPERARDLLDVPARKLADAHDAIGGRTMIPPFSPVADDEIIPGRPFAAIADGSARGIPLIVGTNLEEMKLYRFLDPGIDSLDEESLVMRCSMLQPGDEGGVPRGQRLAELYRSQRAARGEDASPAEAWLAISTDHVFRAGALKLAELQSRHAPVYVYEFAWKAVTPGKPQGAIHALEIPFMFGALDSHDLGAIAGRTPAAYALSERMQELWLSFARSGKPAAPGIEWPAYALPRRATLELSDEPVVREAPREPERAAWDSVIG